MERFRNITIIFLLAVGLLNSIAPPICFANRSSGTKSASVLLQEGLYAEQIDGDLDAAIRIYRQVIAEAKETQRAAAQATYRIGMCYLKKGEKGKAAGQFRDLIVKFPEQESLVTNAGKQLAKLKPIGGFAPVIERVVYQGGTDYECLIDFESGKLFKIPEDLKDSRGKESEVLEWIKETGIDAVGDTEGPITSQGLQGFVNDLVAQPAVDGWNTTPRELVETMGSLLPEPRGKARMFGKDVLPATYFFKTRDGGMGVLQILGSLGDPRGVEVRYKMLRERAKTVAVGWRKVFLPDADSKGLDVVLDLASGELLPASEGKQQLIGTFAELGKGDLAYDRALICLRGAKAGRIVPNHAVYDWGEHLVSLKVLQQTEDTTAYQLDIGHIPGRFQITTAEGDNYDLTILSADSSGVNIRYAKIPPQQLAGSSKPYAFQFYAEITPDGVLNFKSTMTHKNSDSSVLTTDSFTTSNLINITAMHDDKGKPLQFTHKPHKQSGNFCNYNVTLNEPVMPGENYNYSKEGTMTNMVEHVANMENTFLLRMTHHHYADRLMTMTFLLPKGAELISTNPADIKRTEKDGRIKLHNEKLIGDGRSISTQFKYKLTK